MVLVSVFSGMSAVKAGGETEGVAVHLPEPDGLGLSGLTQLKLNVGFQLADCDKFFILGH